MKTYLMVLVIPFLLAACEKTKDLASESEAIEGGTWATGCLDSGSSFYAKYTTSYVGGQFTNRASVTMSSSCSLEILRADTSGSYVLAGVQSDDTKYQKVDITLGTSILTIYDSSLVSSYNSTSYCGFNDWAVAVGKDITGQTCSGYTMATAGTRVYNIFYVTNGVLKFGIGDSSHDGSSDTLRPITLDDAFSFTRQ